MITENINKNFKQVFKYRNSTIFKNNYGNEQAFLKSLKTKEGLPIDIGNENKLHLSKLLEVTLLPDFIYDFIHYIIFSAIKTKNLYISNV